MSSSEIRFYLELIYFISGPIVAIGVIIALIQYSLFAKDISTKYNREIGRQAIDDITTFNLSVIPQYLAYECETKSPKTMSFTFDGDVTDIPNKDLLESAFSFSESISENARRDAKELIMHLNKLCLSFQLGISDETKTYDIIGERFTEIFQQISFAAILIHYRKEANLTALFNTYNKWKNWSDVEKAESEFQAQKDNLDALTIATKNPIKPFGA
jgi:hypothetical protein